MDQQIQIKPDYNCIYFDIIQKKFPEKKEKYLPLLSKQELSVTDIIELNQKLFGTQIEAEKFNQRQRSYNKSYILQILEYQIKHNLNNSQLANHFKLSRNTVAKWKKLFSNDIIPKSV